MDKIEKMFLNLNSVLVEFWKEQGRPDKETKIALLERMLNWYKKMGYITLDTLSEEPNESLEEEIEKCWKNWLSQSNQPSVEGVLPKSEFMMYARHFAEWGAKYLRNSTKMIDKSLKEAAEDWEISNPCAGTIMDIRKEAFKAGAEWQASQMPMPEDTVLFNKGVAEGRRLEREDMFGDEISCEIDWYDGPILNYPIDQLCEVLSKMDIDVGDKVKLIIIKNDEQD